MDICYCGSKKEKGICPLCNPPKVEVLNTCEWEKQDEPNTGPFTEAEIFKKYKEYYTEEMYDKQNLCESDWKYMNTYEKFTGYLQAYKDLGLFKKD